MYNKATLIGHLGRDPEMRTTGAGKRVANLRLATSETWKDKNTGERKERTEWHSVVIFNENLARIVEQYTKKGSRIQVVGTIRTRKWQDQSGADRYSTEIVLEDFGGEILLLDRPERREQSPDDYGTTSSRPAASRAGEAAGRGYSNDLDDDIPF